MKGINSNAEPVVCRIILITVQECYVLISHFMKTNLIAVYSKAVQKLLFGKEKNLKINRQRPAACPERGIN